MQFPPDIQNFESLMLYLASSSIPALCKSSHRVDFHSPVFRSYKRHESVYTWSDGGPFQTVVFGRVAQTVYDTAKEWEADRRTFKLCCEQAPENVTRAFRDQLYEVARAVRYDDEQDELHGGQSQKTPEVVTCTDSDRESAAGGRQLVVDVDELNVNGELQTRTPVGDGEWTLQVGDWVVCTATLHKYETTWSPFTRTYYMLAAELLLFDSGEAPHAVRRRSRRLLQGSVSPPLPYSPTQARRRKRTASNASGPDAEPSTSAMNPLLEQSAEPHTPKKKRRTARISTGGHPPRRRTEDSEKVEAGPSHDAE
ncbi:hypothetical protein B0H15DRAFT_796766 [Mycena belliarum]|uniref:Uncharacterized protein n=1 Tax=Mycena belliarum TaxID=1033014 RepID=A0AAD6UE17_9AGAR|nr:hypothetical protein B0H15DRAFT_796766 [Mycena belliae]